MEKKKPVVLPFREYAKPIYEAWDKRGHPKPPTAYKTWMEMLEALYPEVKK